MPVRQALAASRARSRSAKTLMRYGDPVPHPGDVGDALLDLGPAPVADSNRADEGDDRVPGVKQLLDLDPKLGPDIEAPLQEGPVGLAAPKDAFVRQAVGDIDLYLPGPSRRASRRYLPARKGRTALLRSQGSPATWLRAVFRLASCDGRPSTQRGSPSAQGSSNRRHSHRGARPSRDIHRAR